MTENTNPTTKTRKIAGHKITLESGKWYLASRPMASYKGQTFPISIRDEYNNEVLALAPMSYDAANAFLNAFNNGETSFDGRDW